MDMDSNSTARQNRDGSLTVDLLRDSVAQFLGDGAGIDDDANLIHLGLGSLEIMRLVGRWRRMGIPADFGALAAEPTINGWARYFAAIHQQQTGEVNP
jgi:aryl carrier-like protein